MSQDPGARQFSPGTKRLSRTHKATIEKQNLHLEGDTGYLSLNAAEAARLADFLRDQSEYPNVAEKLERISQYVAKGEITQPALDSLLFAITMQFLPKEILQQVGEIVLLLGKDKPEGQE
jgi:hypothetical protein